MKSKSIYIAMLAAAILVPLVIFGVTLAEAKARRVAAFGYRGGSLFDRRDFSMAGTLVKQPKLIDAGFGRNIDQQFRTMPLLFRAITFYSLWQPAADQLMAAGYAPNSLHAILLTHSHWDHVSGLPDFPGIPVWVTSQEHEFIRQSGPMDFCKLFTGIRYEEYGFEGEPYLGFPRSHDGFAAQKFQQHPSE